MEAGTLPSSVALLIVDDEPLMTELFNHFMSKRGFQVLTASSGREALEIVAREGKTIRMVITDMTMPGMDGLDLARQLLAAAPEIPLLLATGHEPDMEMVADLPNVVDVVRKPYQNKVLAERIHELLNID